MRLRPATLSARTILPVGCVLLGGLGLFACHTQPTAAVGAASQAAAGSAGYQVFRGQGPGAGGATAYLVTSPQGSYGSYHGPDGRPHELESGPGAADSLVLYDLQTNAQADNSQQGCWLLRRQPGSNGWSGTINGQPAQLQPVPPPAGALTLTERTFADSTAAFPQQPGSPKANLQMQLLVPTGGPPAVRQALETAIGQDLLRSLRQPLRNDTATRPAPATLPAFYQQWQQELFRNYRQQVTEVVGQHKQAGLGGISQGLLSCEVTTKALVLCQQGNLLSLGYDTYTFEGGANGLHTVTAANYDLRTGHPLRYSDIFRPGAEVQLSLLLERAVRPQLQAANLLHPGEPLSKALLVKKMPVTHNVCLASGGVEFIYQPIEIAAHYVDVVRVFVPFSQLRPLLRANLPLAAWPPDKLVSPGAGKVPAAP